MADWCAHYLDNSQYFVLRLAQSLPAFVKHYDYTAIMAMPYMENEAAIDSLQAAEWLKGLVTTVQNSGLPSEKIVFELQTVNWRSERPLPAGEITNWLHILRQTISVDFYR